MNETRRQKAIPLLSFRYHIRIKNETVHQILAVESRNGKSRSDDDYYDGHVICKDNYRAEPCKTKQAAGKAACFVNRYN